MKNLKTLDAKVLKEKRVLVRCDFNVPLDAQGDITDDFRLKETLPTIKYLMENNARIILMSHLGEPDGKVVALLKLDKVQEKLSELLGLPVEKAGDCVGPEVARQADELKPGRVLLLENLRFHKEEKENNPDFAQELSQLADIYVNDAFSVCHRNHASIAGVPKYLPACAGFLLEREIFSLNKVLENPARPMAAIIGGKKAETKTKLINQISKLADFVIISGLIKQEAMQKKIIFDFSEKIIEPEDSLNAPDIDEKTIELFREKIKTAKTVLWNGPFGKTEDEMHIKGTLAIAKAIIESRAYSVVGGGETIEFLGRQGLLAEFSHVSSGGGAMLAYLAGDKLPGLEALG